MYISTSIGTIIVYSTEIKFEKFVFIYQVFLITEQSILDHLVIYTFYDIFEDKLGLKNK